MKILTQSYDIACKLIGSRNDKYSHFCFIFSRNKLISIGQNNMSEPSMKAMYFNNKFGSNREFHFLHAETDAISKLWGRRYITGREKVVVLRINKQGKLLNSRPCVACKTVMDAIGLNRVYFSTEKGFVNA